MKILAIEREDLGIKAEDFKPHLEKEAKKVWELYESGIIREIYFGQELHNAHIIMECESKVEATSILNKLPLVQNNMIYFELTVLEPYTGFSRLFTKTEE